MVNVKIVERAVNNVVQRLAVSDLASIYGCCGLFDMCGDADLMSLSFAGNEPFLDVLDWQPSNVCKIHKDFITWVRPERNRTSSPGWLADPCGDPYTVEYGTCAFEIEDFGRLRREGPVRDITKAALRLCENQPRYRLDGAAITDDMEYGIRLATEVLMQDLKTLLVLGTTGTAGQFDGLRRLVKTGYTAPDGHFCRIMDSIVVDWNDNDMSGGDGITWNGRAVSDDVDFVSLLLAVYRRIRDRLQMAPALSGALVPGDIVLVMPTALIRCLLDAYTCWSVCPTDFFAGSITGMNTLEGRRYRDSLNGGMFGAGRIFLDGFEIPLVPYNWGLINGPSHFDAYMLTLKVGGIRLVQGQYNDMRNVLRLPGMPAGAGTFAQATDGGRLLTWPNADQTCVKHLVEMQPRLLMWAPWAQARIQDVVCNQPGGPLSPDPDETSFFPETSFRPAECPEEEQLAV
jgi:hypothetical protein